MQRNIRFILRDAMESESESKSGHSDSLSTSSAHLGLKTDNRGNVTNVLPVVVGKNPWYTRAYSCITGLLLVQYEDGMIKSSSLLVPIAQDVY